MKNLVISFDSISIEYQTDNKEQPLYKRKDNRLKLKDLPWEQRPREKVKIIGLSGLTDTELIALILGSGTAQMDVLRLANAVEEILHEISHDKWMEQLLTIPGIGKNKAMAICASLEYSRRKFKPATSKVNNPEDLFPWLRSYTEKKQEYFLVFALNGANEVISRRVVTIGLLNSSQIHPREVFAEAISERAAAIILAHNHPSGEITPSREDIYVTEKISRAGNILGIPVLDHIIFSHTGFYSMMEFGYISKELPAS